MYIILFIICVPFLPPGNLHFLGWSITCSSALLRHTLQPNFISLSLYAPWGRHASLRSAWLPCLIHFLSSPDGNPLQAVRSISIYLLLPVIDFLYIGSLRWLPLADTLHICSHTLTPNRNLTSSPGNIKKQGLPDDFVKTSFIPCFLISHLLLITQTCFTTFCQK